MGKSCGHRSTGGKSLADFAETPQRVDPVYNHCPLFQNRAHVYSFWHQGQEADSSVFTETPQFSQRHANKQHCHDAMRQPNTPPETSCSNNQFARISIHVSSQCLQTSAFAELKVRRCDLWVSDYSITNGICDFSHATGVPLEVPGREYCFPRTHDILNCHAAMMKETNFHNYESN